MFFEREGEQLNSDCINDNGAFVNLSIQVNGINEARTQNEGWFFYQDVGTNIERIHTNLNNLTTLSEILDTLSE